MPPTGASQTPSTATKRARGQTTASGSLSLLAVPKLKPGNAVPKAEPVKASGTSQNCHLIKQKPAVFQEHSKCSQTKAAKVSAGKENLPAHVSSPATVVKQSSGSSASVLQPNVTGSDQAKPLLDKRKQNQVCSKSLSSASSQKASQQQHHLAAAQHARDAAKATHTHAAAPRSARHVSGAAVMAEANEAVQAASPAHASTERPTPTAGASTSHATACDERDQEDELGLADVPLACHTAINKRRRPVERTRRYGDWYTGNDTDLDEHLHEYNAEQKHAQSTLSRRNSALPSYTADLDDSDYTEDEEQKSVKRVSRLRRITIAPGQDTAAQVAAMTAELSRLADDMLPQEEQEVQGKPGRRQKQGGKEASKDLRQRLLDSWDGKTYYERLQAEADHQGAAATSASSEHGQAQQVVAAPPIHIPIKAAVKPARPKHPAKGLPPRPATHQDPRQKAHAAAPLLSSRTQAQNSPRVQQQQQQQPVVDAQVGKSAKHVRSTDSKQAQQSIRASDSSKDAARVAQDGTGAKQVKSTEGQQTQQGSRASDCSLAAASAAQSYQAATSSSQQRQRARTQNRKTDSDGDAALASAAPIERAQQTESCAVNSPAAAAPSEPKPRLRGRPSAGTGGLQTNAGTVTRAEGPVIDQPLDQLSEAARGRHAGSSNQVSAAVKTANKGSSAGVWGLQTNDSIAMAAEGPVIDHSLDQQSQVVEGRLAGSSTQRSSAVKAADKGSSAGQQQIAHLTAANTALLSELVDMQGAAAMLKTQLGNELSARLAADQERARVAHQLAEEKQARLAAEQQVTLLQQTILKLRAQHADTSLQMQAPTASIAQDRLNAVKRHAAALAEAAAAMELIGLEN